MNQKLLKLKFVIAFVLTSIQWVTAQNKDSLSNKSNGIQLRMFADYQSNLGGNDIVEPTEMMELSRIYLGYKYQLDAHFSGQAMLDAENVSGRYNVFVKIAEFSYKNGPFQINAGVIPTLHFKVQEEFWGYRYILKSFGDQYKFNSSADLGVSAQYQLFKVLKMDLGLFNGEGFKNLSRSGTYRFSAGTSFDWNGIVARLYYDASLKSDVGRHSFVGFAGYKFKKLFRVFGEYNYQLNNGYTDLHNLYGFSVGGAFIVNPKIEIMARFDQLGSNIIIPENPRPEVVPQAWNANRDESTYMLGVHYQLTKGLNVSLNGRRALSVLPDSKWVNWLFFNLEFRI